MLGRIFICAIAMGSAVPATAGRRVEYRPVADSLALLMQDDRAVAASHPQPPIVALPLLRAFRMRDPISAIVDEAPVNTDLASFEALRASTFIPARFTPRREVQAPASLFLSRNIAVRRGWVEASLPDEAISGSLHAVRTTLAQGQYAYRHSALEGMVDIELDGRQDTPWLSVSGGIAAALWQMLPKN